MDLDDDVFTAFVKRWAAVGIAGLVVLALAFFATRLYTSYRVELAMQEADLFYAFEKQAKQLDLQGAHQEFDRLKARFADGFRTQEAALLLSKLYFDASQPKQALQLLQDAKNSKNPEIKALAQMRSAVILADLKQFGQALQQIPDDPKIFEQQFKELKGDIYLLKGDKEAAAEQYKSIIDKLEKESPSRFIVRLKIDSLTTDEK